MEHMREPEKSPAPSVIAANARAAPGGGLEWVLDAVVDESCKAWPPQLGPRRVRDIGGLGLNLYRGDLPAPVAVLREEALAALGGVGRGLRPSPHSRDGHPSLLARSSPKFPVR